MLRLGRRAIAPPILPQTRNIRMKGNKLFSVSSEKESELLLKNLEAQYELAKARLAEEDEAKRKAGTDRGHRPPKPEPKPQVRPLDSIGTSIWGASVSTEDRKKLASYGIKSLEELQAAYQEAESDLNRPPYPPVERLRPRLRLAHQAYKSIPKSLSFGRKK